MHNIKCFSCEISVFHGRKVPESAFLVGYGALIEVLQLEMPIPAQLAIISKKHKRYNTQEWAVFTPRYQPKETLYDQLVFALKYEALDLLFFKKLFEKLSVNEVQDLVQTEPQGQYARRIWFLYEWLLEVQLPIPDLETGNYVLLLDPTLQYSIEDGERCKRNRVINNLPGTKDFCPLIRKTEKLENYIEKGLANQNREYLRGIHQDIILRTSSFLLLKDSKASFNIEGESPKSKRMARWGQAIGQAGDKELTLDELARLQQVVIESSRFTKMGFRKQGGFVGEHDRVTSSPIPEHISARWQDVELLMQGLVNTTQLLLEKNIDAVISAASIAFGFVFIHPFADGNGRIHRYLIHHLLAKKQFTQQGIIFPVSASILNHLADYRSVLQAYSNPLLDFIQWEETKDHNVVVVNETIDFYRYFDLTKQAEFLYDCVNDTIETIIPEEIDYLKKYEEFKRFLDDEFEMPDKMVDLLIKFLSQNNGQLSKRAKEKEFEELTDAELIEIERNYAYIFG